MFAPPPGMKKSEVVMPQIYRVQPAANLSGWRTKSFWIATRGMMTRSR
jgi:hypothetical protein